MDKILDSYEHDFDHSLDRWRALYKQAQLQIEEASAIINNRVYGENSQEKRDAHVKQARGENQRDMLLGVNQGKNKEENQSSHIAILQAKDSCLVTISQSYLRELCSSTRAILLSF